MADIITLLEEIESDNIQNQRKKYSSAIYQPSRLAVSSQNAIPPIDNYNPQTDNSFYNFTVNLPRAIIAAKSIQLLRCSIPQCSPSIPDNSLVFYYYRLPTQTDINGDSYFTELPNIYNLYVVRLLPSYYKQELISNPGLYGYNQTFYSYSQLQGQLNLATINDLAYNNQVTKTMPFISGDITFSITNNRFQFTGNNVNTPIAFPAWNSTYIYRTNTIVSYSGSNYICIGSDVLNVVPTNTTFWSPYVQTTNFYTYLAAGYEDPNVLTLQGTSYNVVWNPYHNYNTGDWTWYNGVQYSAKMPNMNRMPPFSLYWNVGSSSPIVAQGISGISQTYDFELLASIPPQPFIAPPDTNSTLNLILGFTWNGANFQLTSLITPTTYPAGSAAPLLFNRLRPIPVYASSGFGSYPQTTTGTYTADAYCNLVFSSLVSIYCDLVSASTLDSQRNNNLLSIIPLNCPNLGVTFYNNVIDTPLTKIVDEIGKIYVELRDDKNQPFYVSNNGIVTLEIKITY